MIVGEDTHAVLKILGTQVRLARGTKKWTAEQAAVRAGVSARTVTAIERGTPQVAVGKVFEVALAVGVDLLGTGNRDNLEMLAASYDQAASLLPVRVRAPQPAREVFRDF
ncbi:MAG: helix-turn-helix domain-containing protein [Cellulomonadaceae bacterium]|jgi:transcriptional regulator with XRE-family HTH domain|nr:helix-turn-helix domain-containing protein [Cellulomonadaceae bacterium]